MIITLLYSLRLNWSDSDWFQFRIHFMSRCNMIVWVGVVLKKTVVDSD